MAIASYSDLVTAIQEWLGRDNDATLLARIPDLITLAEAKFNRLLFAPQMEKRSTATIDITSTDPEFISLPSDFQTMRRVRLNSVTGKPGLQMMSQTQLDDYRYSIDNVTGQPVYFAIVGVNMELAPTPNENYTLEMVYRSKLAGLTVGNPSNWLIALAPDLYLYGTLLESAPYLQDDERVPLWAAAMQLSLDQINSLGERQSYGSTPASLSLPGVVP